MTKKELQKILEKHQKWLVGEKGGKQAILSGANLSFINLSCDNLVCANLNCANLGCAVLRNTNLRGADLTGAKLTDTNLTGAILRGANLEGADLRGADLKGADLRWASLINVLLDKKEKIRKGIILDKPMIGYKKCKDGVIVKLEIPKGAIVFSINNNKCRTNKAKCIEIYGAEKATSNHDENFVYEVGKTYEIKDFDLTYNIECAAGIHFFRTKKEAKDYVCHYTSKWHIY